MSACRSTQAPAAAPRVESVTMPAFATSTSKSRSGSSADSAPLVQRTRSPSDNRNSSVPAAPSATPTCPSSRRAPARITSQSDGPRTGTV